MIHPASIDGGAPVAIPTRKRHNTQNISHVPLIVKHTMLSTAIGSRRSPDYGSERTAGVEDVPNSFQACPSECRYPRDRSHAWNRLRRAWSFDAHRRRECGGPCSCAFVDLNEVDFRRTDLKMAPEDI